MFATPGSAPARAAESQGRIFYCEQNDAFIAGLKLEQLARNNDSGCAPFRWYMGWTLVNRNSWGYSYFLGRCLCCVLRKTNLGFFGGISLRLQLSSASTLSGFNSLDV